MPTALYFLLSASGIFIAVMAWSAVHFILKNVKEEDVRAFVEEAVQISETGDKNNVDAVLQVSVSANKEIYESIRRCDKVMGTLQDDSWLNPRWKISAQKVRPETCF